jgi:hypothetical protein
LGCGGGGGGVDSVQSWKSGETVVTLIDSGKTMRISGKGPMQNYGLKGYDELWWVNAPWCDVAYTITDLVIENGVTHIGSDAFNYITELTSVTIPRSLITIGHPFDPPGWGFFNCINLTSINVSKGNPVYCSRNGVLFSKAKDTLLLYPPGKQGVYAIPHGITSIGNRAFERCTKLTSVIIPNSVTYIGMSAFGYCDSLKSITVRNPTPPELEYHVFRYIDSNACLYVPKGSIDAYRKANEWKDFKCIKPIASAPK